MRRDDQRDLVADFGRAVGERHGFAHTFDAGARDEDLIRRGEFLHPSPQLDFLAGGKQLAFSGGADDDVAGQPDQVQASDVVLHLDLPDVAVVIERCGEGWKDSLEFHSVWKKRGGPAAPRKRCALLRDKRDNERIQSQRLDQCEAKKQRQANAALRARIAGHRFGA